MHCLREFEELTSDHAFPQSWYPDSTPVNLEKWQAPCCVECNRRLSKVEEELLTYLGLCIDSNAPECAGIADKVVRSMDPSYAKNERDRRFREAKLNRIVGRLKPLSGARKGHPLIALSSAPSEPLVEIAVKLIEEFGEKFIRGITYAIDKSYIEEDYEITVAYSIMPMDEFDRFAGQHCALHDRGPGIVFYMGRPDSDPKAKLYLVRIFGTFVLRAIVLPKEYAARVDQRIADEMLNRGKNGNAE